MVLPRNGNDVLRQKGPILSLLQQHPTFRQLSQLFYPSFDNNTNNFQPTNSLSQHIIAATMVYTLVVHLYAKEDQESINKLIAKLQEASQVYTNDKECLGW